MLCPACGGWLALARCATDTPYRLALLLCCADDWVLALAVKGGLLAAACGASVQMYRWGRQRGVADVVCHMELCRLHG